MRQGIAALLWYKSKLLFKPLFGKKRENARLLVDMSITLAHNNQCTKCKKAIRWTMGEKGPMPNRKGFDMWYSTTKNGGNRSSCSKSNAYICCFNSLFIDYETGGAWLSGFVVAWTNLLAMSAPWGAEQELPTHFNRVHQSTRWVSAPRARGVLSDEDGDWRNGESVNDLTEWRLVAKSEGRFSFPIWSAMGEEKREWHERCW